MVKAGKRKKDADPASAWARERGLDLPSAEVPPTGSMVFDEGTTPEQDAPPRPAKLNKEDMVRQGFDPEVGLVVEQPKPPEDGQLRPAPSAARELRRWTILAGQVAERLDVLMKSAADAQRAIEQRGVVGAGASRWLVEDAPGLAELEALSRVLWPWGWEAALEQWFRSEAKRRLEQRARPLWEADKAAGKRLLVLTPAEPFSAEAFLEVWRDHDVGVAGHLPPEVTPELLDAIVEHVNRGGGRAGGYTPARAVELTKLGALDPDGLRLELEKVAAKKAARAKKAKAARQKP